MGLEARIRKVDRYQRRATLDVEFAEELCEMKLSLEVEKK